MVPPIGDRRRTIRRFHVSLKHAALASLLEALSREYWWPTMRMDCMEILAMCSGCVVE